MLVGWCFYEFVHSLSRGMVVCCCYFYEVFGMMRFLVWWCFFFVLLIYLFILILYHMVCYWYFYGVPYFSSPDTWFAGMVMVLWFFKILCHMVCWCAFYEVSHFSSPDTWRPSLCYFYAAPHSLSSTTYVDMLGICCLPSRHLLHMHGTPFMRLLISYWISSTYF